MKIIERASYIDQVMKLLGKGEVVVLTGHRRAGKSCILEKLAEKLSSEGHVIFLDMENPDNAFIDNYMGLNEFVKTNMNPTQQNFLLIDEVQEIDGFEKTLRFWAKQEQLEIIVTGSNAYMLSGELATLFAGRHTPEHIYSLDFEEYKLFYALEDQDDTLVSYLRWGGLPFGSSLCPENRPETAYSEDGTNPEVGMSSGFSIMRQKYNKIRIPNQGIKIVFRRDVAHNISTRTIAQKNHLIHRFPFFSSNKKARSLSHLGHFADVCNTSLFVCGRMRYVPT